MDRKRCLGEWSQTGRNARRVRWLGGRAGIWQSWDRRENSGDSLCKGARPPVPWDMPRAANGGDRIRPECLPPRRGEFGRDDRESALPGDPPAPGAKTCEGQRGDDEARDLSLQRGEWHVGRQVVRKLANRRKAPAPLRSQ